MKKLLTIAVVCAIGIGCGHAATITSGATVTLNGTFFTDPGPWSVGTNATAQDLVSGVYQPEMQQWDLNSVWWNGAVHPGNTITLDLNGTFAITGFKVQADDNDIYQIDYLAPGSSVWAPAWTVPAPGGFGLTTSSTTLGGAITATDLRFEAIGGDGYYAVSQIEAFGRAVPAGVPDSADTLGLMSAGLALLGLACGFRRR